MRLKIEAIPNRNGPGEEIAVYADEEAMEQLIDSLGQARDLPFGLAFAQIGNHNVHIFRTAFRVDE